jgi:GxxExxY protein
MRENDLSTIVIGAAIKIHRELGPGLLESAYEQCMAYELELEEISFEQQVYIPLIYKEIKIDKAFKADFLIEDKLIVELKSVENLMDVHKSQLLTYLRLTDKRLGLLINFNNVLLKNGITRVVNNLY